MNFRGKLLDYLRQRDRGWVLLLLLLTCLVYVPFLGNHFFFDDLSFFYSGIIERQYQGFNLIPRSLPYAILAWMNAAFTAELPYVYRVVSLLVHAAAALMLFYFLRQLLSAVPATRAARNAAGGAWFGAAVFALHPVAAFAAGYVVQLSILMATLFALLMLWAYLRGLLSGQRRWFALAVVAYFLACFSKEHAVLMPLVAGALGLLVRTELRAPRSVLGAAWGGFAAIALFVILQAKGVLGSAYEPMAGQLFTQQGVDAGSTAMLHVLSALTQAGLFFKYLLLWALPEQTLMSIDMRESFLVSAASWQGWLGAVAFLAYGGLGLRLLLQGGIKGLAGFAMLFPWLLFGVELAGIRTQEPFVLYRSYLWMSGVTLLLPLALMKLPERKALLVMAAVVVVLIPLSWQRLQTFSDDYRLWNEAATQLKSARTSGADRIFFNRGQAEAAAEKWDAAAADFRRAAAISPRLAPVHFELGWAYFMLGRDQEAMAEFDTALANDPNYANAYYGKGWLYEKWHDKKGAAENMTKGCALGHRVACMLLRKPID